jgi:hypothetical protein
VQQAYRLYISQSCSQEQSIHILTVLAASQWGALPQKFTCHPCSFLMETLGHFAVELSASLRLKTGCDIFSPNSRLFVEAADCTLYSAVATKLTLWGETRLLTLCQEVFQSRLYPPSQYSRKNRLKSSDSAVSMTLQDQIQRY